MPLINDDIAKVRQHPRELGVDGQDAAVQHVGVCDQQLGPVPDLGAFALHQMGSTEAQPPPKKDSLRPT